MCVILVGSLMGRCRYLIHEELAKHPGSRVLFIIPTFAVLINKRNPGIKIPHLTHASHIFIPINDGGAAEGPSGSHWSLLVISRHDRRAFYYDSYRSMLVRQARDACQVISGLLGFKIDFVDLKDTPQQKDSSSCGVFICWAMKHLLVRRLLAVESNRSVDMSLAEKDMDLVSVREEMQRLILNLRQMACRRLFQSASATRFFWEHRADTSCLAYKPTKSLRLFRRTEEGGAGFAELVDLLVLLG
jgi:sentrin-specific protease 8